MTKSKYAFLNELIIQNINDETHILMSKIMEQVKNSGLNYPRKLVKYYMRDFRKRYFAKQMYLPQELIKIPFEPKQNVINTFNENSKRLKIAAKEYINKSEQLENVLVIADLHEPFSLDGYFDFCAHISKKYNTTKTIFIGDVIDDHFQSFHNTDADGYGAGEELLRAKDRLQKWHTQFPNSTVTLGNHDCYDQETEVLTTNGWKLGIDLDDNDIVGTMNLDTCELEYHKPEKLILKDYDGEMIRFKNPGTSTLDLLVTPGHRIIYSEKDFGKHTTTYKIDEAFKISKGRKLFPVSCICNNKDYNISDDELKLLAWIITDGSLLECGRYCIYQSKLEMIEEIKKILTNLNIEFVDKIRERDTSEIRGIKLLKKPLISHEIYFRYEKFNSIINNKYILPKLLYNISNRQFEIFINSIVDGDGSRFNDWRKVLTVYGKKSLLEQLQILCLQFSCRTYIKEYRPNDFLLYINLNCRNIGSEVHETVSTEYYKGKVWCATVPTTTLIVRRNNIVHIQGNCIVSRRMFAAGLSKEWIRDIKDVLNTPTWNYVEEYEFQNVIYLHGTAYGDKAAYNQAMYRNKSVVQGHVHTSCSVQYVKQDVFGAIVGCGINTEQYAFNYAKGFIKKPIIACMAIVGGTPIIEVMKM